MRGVRGWSAALALLAGCLGEAPPEAAGNEVAASRTAVESSEGLSSETQAPFPIEVEIQTGLSTPVELEVWITAEAPTGLLATGDLRLLPDTLEWNCFSHDARETWQNDGWTLEQQGERATWRTTLRGEGLGREVWVCVTSESGGCAPQALALAPPADATRPRLARFDLTLRGGVRGRVFDPRDEQRDDEDLALYGRWFELGIAGSDSELGVDDAGEFIGWPLPAGPASIEVVREFDHALELRRFDARVADSALTDLGELRLDDLPVEAIVRARDAEGMAVDFTLTADLGWRRPSCETDVESGVDAVELRGSNWEQTLLVAAADGPWESETVDPRDLADGFVELTFSKPAPRLLDDVWISVRDGEGWTEGTPLVFTRRPDGAWRARPTSYIGCSLYSYSLYGLESGEHELLAWSPHFAGAVHTHVELRGDVRRQHLSLELDRDVGAIEGRLDLRAQGFEANSEVLVWIQPSGAEADGAVIERCAAYDVRGALEHGRGPFEIAGVPAGVDLELFIAERGRVLARRPVRVAAGEELDLGCITVELP